VYVRRCCRSAATLAALAVAIARDDERLGHLEPNGTAITATGECGPVHLQKSLPVSVLGADRNNTARRRRRRGTSRFRNRSGRRAPMLSAAAGLQL
jgi:hypothetical protein